MKLTDEQKQKIVKELNSENKDGILYRVFDDLRRVFQPFLNPGEIRDFSREYEINSEELEELTRDISKFEENGEFWESYRLYEYNEKEDDVVLYFDFNRDVVPVIEVIRKTLVAKYKITLDMDNLRGELIYAVWDYLERIGIMPGYYYYHKDHFGEEKCYYAGRWLQNDQENVLYLLSKKYPVKVIFQNNWNLMKYEDTSDPLIKVRNETIQKAIDKPSWFPMTLVTHLTDDLTKKYEIVNVVDYDALIHEYAAPYDYQIEPTYIRGVDITREEAIERGMYALAKEIELYELKQEDKDE